MSNPLARWMILNDAAARDALYERFRAEHPDAPHEFDAFSDFIDSHLDARLSASKKPRPEDKVSHAPGARFQTESNLITSKSLTSRQRHSSLRECLAHRFEGSGCDCLLMQAADC